MEHVDGYALSEISSMPMSEHTALRFFRQLLWGLDAIHEEDYVHRDIKASNLLIDDSRWSLKISDFGLALPANQECHPVQAGTPDYMSPEQANGDLSLDRRTDLYSAGVVLYELLTGRLPFRGESSAEIIDQIRHAAPVSPEILNSDVNQRLAQIATRLLAKQPEDRFQTSSEALKSLDHAFPPKRRSGTLPR